MRIHRRWVLGGFPSLLAADTHVGVGARARGQATPVAASTSLRSALGMASPIPRPPGVPDDDPDVLAGVYA